MTKYRLSLLVAVLMLQLPLCGYSQKSISDLQPGYYLVTGVFQVSYNAKKYSQFIENKGYENHIGYNIVNNLNYVYLDYSNEFDNLLDGYYKFRKQRGFEETWILRYFPNHEEPVSQRANVEPVEEDDIAIVEEASVTEQNGPEEDENINQVAEQNEAVETTEGYPFVFNTVNLVTMREVPGNIIFVDGERNKVVSTFPSNEHVIVPDPHNGTNKAIFICEMFGFKKQQIDLTLGGPYPETPNIEHAGDTVYVNFSLIRYSKGDVATMYNVYFYTDAIVMKPESKFELNSLLDMMQENENFEIKIHGHTNGNAAGKIIDLRKENDFFGIGSDNPEEYGSAKKLSKKRAEAVKNWLVSKGIDANRIEAKGWGGKKMLYDKFDASAKRNVRVEVEVIKE